MVRAAATLLWVDPSLGGQDEALVSGLAGNWVGSGARTLQAPGSLPTCLPWAASHMAWCDGWSLTG